MTQQPDKTSAPRRRGLWIVALTLSALSAIAGLASRAGQHEPDALQSLTMKPSVTYLHLLRHTPFFTALTKEQLQWVIDHSREWSADKGAVIARCDATGTTDKNYWILLDGGWQLEHDGRTFPSSHADPGKWFNTHEAHGADCSLIATEHSYVMRITAANMQQMLDQGFAFGRHLDDGHVYYDSIFP